VSELIDEAMLGVLRLRVRQCGKWAKEIHRRRLKDAIETAGDQWGKPATFEQIMAAIDIAGFRIVRKRRNEA
jgi:hypothetical protein